MSKKNKYKDFWGVSAEDQMEESEIFDAMEEQGEIDIFSLGKVKKHYTGLEPEITADIKKVFGNKAEEGVEYEIPEDSFSPEVKESVSFVSSLKDDYDDSADDIHFDPTITGHTKDSASVKKDCPKDNKPSKNDKPNKQDKYQNGSYITPIKLIFNAPILELRDSMVSLYYKLIPDHNIMRYVDGNKIYDDCAVREIAYLIRYIIAFRFPTALYTVEEFETRFDEVKGTFKDSKAESKYMFIDFNDYVGVYYLEGDLFDKISRLKAVRSNSDIADIIMGLAVESLGFNIAFSKEDFAGFYESATNKLNKDTVIEYIKRDVVPSDTITMLDVDSFDTIFDKSEKIIEKYIREDTLDTTVDYNNYFYGDEDSDDDDEDFSDLQDELDALEDEEHEDSDRELDAMVEYDPSIDDDEIPDDEDDDEEDGDEDETSEEPEESSEDENDIDSMIDEAFTEDAAEPDDQEAEETSEEEKSMPIDKVAINNPNKDDKSMVIEVTRKTHA